MTISALCMEKLGAPLAPSRIESFYGPNCDETAMLYTVAKSKLNKELVMAIGSKVWIHRK
jgi:hypothetical protein